MIVKRLPPLQFFTIAVGIGMVMFFLAASAGTATADPNLTSTERLGKSIFFDQHLSINQNQSCAACHTPNVGWTGADPLINTGGGVYEGSIAGRFGDRKPPASAYATFSPILHYELVAGEAVFIGGNFWDGRATGEVLGSPAADQAQGPFLNPAEQALPDSACVVYRVCNPATPGNYPVKFSDVYGADACQITWPADVQTVCGQENVQVALSSADRIKANSAFDNAALAIAAFEGSPESNAFSSKFDYYLTGQAKLTSSQRKGLELFNGAAKCANCHTLSAGPNGSPALFTDFTYDNLGVPKNPQNPIYQTNPNFVDLGLGGFLAKRSDYAQFAAENNGKQKVPTLRNVAKRPNPSVVKAYMHNGYFKTLRGIVHFYNTRDVLPRCAGDFTEAQALAANCWPAPEVTANVNTTEMGNLKLKAKEEEYLVAFLYTLSDGYKPGAYAAEVDSGEQDSEVYLPLISTE